MSNALDGMFPIDGVKKNIEARWIRIASQPFRELEDHVVAQAPNQHSVATYKASLQATSNASNGGAAKRSRPSRWFCLQVEQLEHAVAWCTAAKRLEPKALANMLGSARDCCSRFDQLIDEEKAALAASHANRVKGGKYRQARLDPVREFAWYLAQKDRPAGGWKSPNAAGKAIAPEVGRFIKTRGLSMQTEDFLPQTIARWLRKDFASSER